MEGSMIDFIMTQIRPIMDFHNTMETSKTDIAISEAENEYTSNGTLLDARDVLPALREKYFGKYRALD